MRRWRGPTGPRSEPTASRAADREFEFVFVVTYGRSGSTLVQGLLNAMPHTLVRGENNFYVLPLYRARANVQNFQHLFSKHTEPASSAFYGIADIDLTAFEASARQLMVSQLLGRVDPAGVRILGFKEVLWHRVAKRETAAFFDYFEAVFPGARYVLNQRDHEQVLGSGFWQRRDLDKSRHALDRVEEIQAFLRETRPARVYDIRYEVLTGPDTAASGALLRGLAEFVTGSCDDALFAKLRQTMQVGHGPNPFGASRSPRSAAK
jgi:hypothetical protein